MSRQQIADELKTVSIFKMLPEQSLLGLARQMNRRTFPKGQTILHHQDGGKDVCLLLKGRALAMLVSTDGREMSFSDMRPVTYFGEIAAIDHGNRSANVYALTDCEVAVLPWARFNDLLETEPDVMRALLVDLSARIRTLTNRNFEMMTLKVETRVRAMIVSLALDAGCLKPGGRLCPAPTHMDLASRVGSKREVVSRILSSMVAAGVIRTSRQSIEIVELDQLIDGLEPDD